MAYAVRELMGLVEEKVKFEPFFLSLFFREVFTFDSEEVLLDKLPGKVGMAVYCHPMVSGKVVRTRTGAVTSFKPGYVKVKHEVNPMMTVRRLPGEALNGAMSPADRLDRLRAQNLVDEEFAFLQLEEYQAVQMALHGAYTVSGENIATYELDAGRSPGNTVELTLTDRWSQQNLETYDPLGDIEVAAEAAEGTIDLLIMDEKAWSRLKKFKAVKDKLETRRGSTSTMETALKDLGKVVSWKGTVGDVDIVVYKGKITHPQTGVEQNLMPDNCILLANYANLGIRTYGAIRDQIAHKEGIVEATRFRRNWDEGGDPAVEFTMTQGAPGMFLPSPDEFVTLWPEGLPA
jgi:hypothetical protein